MTTDYAISFYYRYTQKHTEDEVHDKIILNQTLSKHLLHFMHIGQEEVVSMNDRTFKQIKYLARCDFLR